MQTPCYIYDLQILKEQLCFVKEQIKNAKLCFAMKANPLLLRFIYPLVDRIEVCSDGEFNICASLKISPEKIFYTGVNKQKSEVKKALEYGVKLFNAESEIQLKILNDFAKEYNFSVFMRLSCGDQFGIEASEFYAIYEKYKDILDICGVHFFSGTFRDKKDDVANFFGLIKKEFLHKKLEYGAGLSVVYFENEDIDKMKLSKIFTALKNGGVKEEICFELGRYLVANCGFYATKIVDIKTNAGVNYIIVDGGTHQLTYYGQIMGLKIPKIRHFRDENLIQTKGEQDFTIAGSLCAKSDILVRNFKLYEPKINDILIFENCGAYCQNEGANLFLSRNLPSVYIKNENEFAKFKEEFPSYTLNF